MATTSLGGADHQVTTEGPQLLHVMNHRLVTNHHCRDEPESLDQKVNQAIGVVRVERRPGSGFARRDQQPPNSRMSWPVLLHAWTRRRTRTQCDFCYSPLRRRQSCAVGPGTASSSAMATQRQKRVDGHRHRYGRSLPYYLQNVSLREVGLNVPENVGVEGGT